MIVTFAYPHRRMSVSNSSARTRGKNPALVITIMVLLFYHYGNLYLSKYL